MCLLTTPDLGSLVCLCLVWGKKRALHEGTSRAGDENPGDALLQECFPAGSISGRKHFDHLKKETFF